MSPRAQIIVLANQKGGVGKTTNCVHLAAALGASGRRCLLWDFDANQGATTHLGLDGEAFLGCAEILSGAESAADVIISAADDVSLPRNVDVIAASPVLERADATRAHPSVGRALSQLQRLDRYDYVLMDTAPNLTVPTIEAYRAADWFVLSAFPDPFALVGLRRAMDTLRRSMERGTARGRLLGVLLCCVANSKAQPRLQEQMLGYLHQRLGAGEGRDLIFETTIARSMALPRCVMEGRTLFEARPRHKVVRQYQSLAAEIEDRIHELQLATPSKH